MCSIFDNYRHISAIEVDIYTMAIRPIEDLNDECTQYPLYMLTRNNYTIYVSSENATMILKDGKLQFNLDFRPRYRYGKSYYDICGRFHQQFRDNVYMIDKQDSIFSICWTDIEQSMPVALILIDKKIEDFYVTRKGIAIVYTDGNLKLPRSIMVESTIMPADVKWSAVVGASNRWVVAGDDKGYIILVALSTKGLMKSSLKINLNHNGYRPEEYATMHSIKVAVERRHCCLILVFGTDGCFHLTSMSRSGHLMLVQSIASILDPNVDYEDDATKTTLSVTDTGIEGRFIMTGYKQINMICLKFK